MDVVIKTGWLEKRKMQKYSDDKQKK